MTSSPNVASRPPRIFGSPESANSYGLCGRSRLLVERLGMQTRLTPLAFAGGVILGNDAAGLMQVGRRIAGSITRTVASARSHGVHFILAASPILIFRFVLSRLSDDSYRKNNMLCLRSGSHGDLAQRPVTARGDSLRCSRNPGPN